MNSKRVRSTKQKRKTNSLTKTNFKAKNKNPAKKLIRTKAKTKAKTASRSAKIKFYDVKQKKYVRIPRTDCKVRRNRSARGGDRLIGKYKGRELHTFVKKGFKL